MKINDVTVAVCSFLQSRFLTSRIGGPLIRQAGKALAAARVILLVGAVPGFVLAQVATGVPPFSSTTGGPFDVIDPAVLNIHFGIRFSHRAGRGTPFDYVMSYDSSIWNPIANGSTTSWQPVANFGWRGASEALTGYVVGGPTTQKCPIINPDGSRGSSSYTVWIFSGYQDPRGVFHPMTVGTTGGSTACQVNPNPTNSAGATDGSGYTLSADLARATVYDRSGNAIAAPSVANGSGSITDTNGNVLTTTVSGSTTTFTDTLGTTALTISGAAPSPVTYTYTAPNGQPATVTMNYANFNVATNFGVAGVAEYPETSTPLVTGISLPNGTAYSFTYEATPGGCSGCVTGRIASITLPTGGQITYAYTGGSNGILANGVTSGFTRTTPDGTWTYATNGSQTTVTDPQGNQTVYSFQGIYETSRTVYQGSSSGGAKLASIATCWNGQCPTTSVTLPVTQQATTFTFADGKSSQTVTGFNSSGLVTERDEYDFGATAPARKTVIAYAALGNNIMNRPASVTVEDGASPPNVAGQTLTTYDESGYCCATTNNTPQHVAVSGSRGNATTIQSLVSGSAYLTRHMSYNDTGTPATSVDAKGNVTAFNYPDATSTCGNAFPTSVNYPLSITTSATWNCSCGLVASATDANNQTTDFSYDAMYRLIQTTRPDGVEISTQFNDTASPVTIAQSSTANNAVNLSTLDAMGRVVQAQLQNGSAVVSTRAVQIDFANGTVKTSNPYGPSDTPLWTTTTLDPLGRTTGVAPPSGGSYQYSYADNAVTVTDPTGKIKRGSTDALGRLIEVDEPGLTGGQGATGSVSVSGTEQSVSSNSSSNGATAGTAAITINPSAGGSCSTASQDRCNTQVVQTAATSGAGSVTISGSDKPITTTIKHCTVDPTTGLYECTYTPVISGYDSGTVAITVNGHSDSVSFGQGDSSNSIANNLYNAINGDSGASARATLSGSTVYLTAIATGAATNYSLAASASSSLGSFSTATSGSALTGGANTVYETKYDTGSVTVSFTASGPGISGSVKVSETVPYGQNDTGTTLAQALANKFSSDKVAQPLVNASSSSNQLQLVTTAMGNSTNYPITVSAATNSQYLPSGSTSFSPSAPSAFAPGQEGTLYDAGTVTATLNGFNAENPPTETVNYSQGSTAVGIAASLASKIGGDPAWQAAVTVSNTSGSATLSFAAVAASAQSNEYSITLAGKSNLSSSFTSPSFPNSPASANPLTANFSGGQNPTASLAAANEASTTYGYDLLNDLTQVTQGAQTRTYQYDALGRMISATTPEAGKVSYSYQNTDGSLCSGAASNLCVATDARGVVTTESYDALNRLLDVAYNVGSSGAPATPSVSYQYGASAAAYNNGRLLSMTDGPGRETYSYDLLGRVKQVARVTGGATYNIGYGYNAANQVTSLTYPSGDVVNQNFDALGRLSSIAGGGTTYLSVPAGNGYNAAQEALNVTYGSGVAGAFAYNDHQQMSSLEYSLGSNVLLNLGYNYLDANGNNNGQIQAITDSRGAAFSAGYSYDALGRLSQAQTNNLSAANTWRLAWTYDRYGNRLSQTLTGGTEAVTEAQLALDSATNRITGFGYDASGNVLKDPLHGYVFNGENELTGVDSTATYGYDGHRWRVQKTVSGTTTTYIYSGSKVIAEYSGGSLTKEYVYSGSSLLATIAGSAVTYHYADQLSNRLETDAGGNVVRTFGHLPFGDIWYETGAADKWKFTGYERDSQSGESGLDYALNRFYSSTYGRFQSPDLLAGSMGSPQSWNRYAYTGNDPGNFIDPSGLQQEKLAQVDAPVNSIDEFDLLNAFFVSVNAQFGGGWSPVITGSQTYYSYLSPGPGQPPYETIPQQVIFYTWVYTTTDFSSLGTLGDLFSTLFGSSSGSVPVSGTGSGSSQSVPKIPPLIQRPGLGGPPVYYQGLHAVQSLPSGAWKAVQWYLCGNGPFDNVKNYGLEGATKGAIVGGIGGSEAGLPGVALGALAGGVEGWFGGAALGTVTAAACQAAGVYGPAH